MKEEDVTKEQLLKELAAVRQKVTKSEKAKQQYKGSKETPAGSQIGFEMQTFLDAIPFHVMLVDADHKILLANKAIQSDLNLDPEQIIGGYCPKAVHGLEEPYPGCPLEEASCSEKSGGMITPAVI